MQNDTTRQSNLKPLIEAIEARETAERIRQGYLPDPSNPDSQVQPIAGPSSTSTPTSTPTSTSSSTSTHSSRTSGQMNTRPSFTKLDTRPIEQTGQSSSSPTQSQAKTPTPSWSPKREGLVSPKVPAPGQTVDPGRHDDPAELRRLAEEDTKRRIQERGGEADLRGEDGNGNGKVEGVEVVRPIGRD